MRFRLLLAVVLPFAVSIASGQSDDRFEDGDRHHLVLVGFSDSDNVVDWFRRDDRLRQLRAKCHWHRFGTRDALFRSRYAGSMPVDSEPPVLVLADSHGGAIYTVSRSTMPDTADQLYDEMRTAYRLVRSASTDSGRRNAVRSASRLSDSIERMPGLRRRPSKSRQIGLVDELESKIQQSLLGAAVLIGLIVFAASMAANLFFPRR